MRDPLYQDELEQFLEKQVNQHRLYPSDNVWRNIQDSLHGKTRWPALPFILLFIITALVVGTLLVKPETHFNYLKNDSHLLAAQPISAINTDSATAIQSLEESLATSVITQKTIDYATARLQLYHTAPTIVRMDTIDIVHPAVATPLLAVHIPVAIIELPLPETALQAANPDAVAIYPDNYIDRMVQSETVAAAPLVVKQVSTVRQPQVATTPAITLPEHNNSRWSFQLYLAPSASYRRLVSGKNPKVAKFENPAPVAPDHVEDVNKVVTQKPAAGFEAGFAIGYQLNKQFTIKTGLQYNARKYSIDASRFGNERADVALSGRDTLVTYTPYRNLKGSTPTTLSNTYHELALPLSIDWKGWQHNRLAWHVGASVQATYILSTKAFLLSTDYKNYVDGSLLVRRWNINTSFETFLSYTTGNVQWQIGPQFRYQQLSTFKNQYPIREYLLDYGIKIGFTTPIR